MDVEIAETHTGHSTNSFGCSSITDQGLEYVLSLGEANRRKETRQRHREKKELAYALGSDGKRYRRECISRLKATSPLTQA